MNHTLATLICALLIPISAHAGARRFTYLYEVTTGRPGSIDIENWMTFEGHKRDDHGFRQVAFRHEIEFGVTDHFQASVYLADWDYERNAGAQYSGSAIELIYNISNPVDDPIGLAIYQEYKIGRRLFEWESKLLAQKNFGRFVAAYNATLEAAWEGRQLNEREGEFQQSLGLSYELSPRFAIGVEGLHEIALPDWEIKGRGKVFAGPNVSLRTGSIWATVTALAQITRAGDEPDFQLRTIFGVLF